MSGEQQHVESQADNAGAPMTYTQLATTIKKDGYIVIKKRACKVVKASTVKAGKLGQTKCIFDAVDIFNGETLDEVVPSSQNCDVPHVKIVDYPLTNISEDGFVSLSTENGNTKDDVKLPTDEYLLTDIKEKFAEGKNLVVTVTSAMGEEQITYLKDMSPINL